MASIEILAKIKGITYQPLLCRPLPQYHATDLCRALSESTAFIYEFSDGTAIAISQWLTPKRSRSYPLSRVYDTLSFCARKATIIPICKDEGRDGDCDYLQWDTVALMGLLGVYVIPAYYSSAIKKDGYANKITEHVLDADYVATQLAALKNYHSSALHWNVEQFARLPQIGEQALLAYENISRATGVDLSSVRYLPKRIAELSQGMERFLEVSRSRSRAAQLREISTVQPKEFYEGTKVSITISDLVGGFYPLTADHGEISEDELRLIESKHTDTAPIPAPDAIKEGLIKMALFANLTEALNGDVQYKPIGVLRLGTKAGCAPLTAKQADLLRLIQAEAAANGFELDVTCLHSLPKGD